MRLYKHGGNCIFKNEATHSRCAKSTVTDLFIWLCVILFLKAGCACICMILVCEYPPILGWTTYQVWFLTTSYGYESLLKSWKPAKQWLEGRENLATASVIIWRQLLWTFGDSYCEHLATASVNIWRQLLWTFGDSFCEHLATASVNILLILQLTNQSKGWKLLLSLQLPISAHFMYIHRFVCT